MCINKILISSDLLRPLVEKNGNIEYFHKARLDKYYYALIYQLQEAVKVPVEKFSYSNTDFDFHEFYSLCGFELKDVYSWIHIYDLERIPANAIEYYKKYIENSLVIYHEAPDIIKRIHRILNVPYIDLNVHPIRFLDDNFWGILTNKKEIFDRIKKHQIDERSFYIYANLIKAQTKSWYDSKISPNSLLFTGQTNIDKSLYSNGRAMAIFDYEDRIKEFGQKYSKVYYKAHPYNDDLKSIYKFLKQFNFVEIIDENFYKLCADDNIAAVASITSGTLYEAKYFGKESIFLGKPYIHFNYDKNCDYDENTTLSLYHDFLTPQFWVDVLQDVVEVKKDIQELTLPHRNNEIRTAFGDYWGQTELDPGVEINKRHFANIENALQITKIDMENALQKNKIDTENALQKTKTDLYAYIDKCGSSLRVAIRALQEITKRKMNKFFYREIYEGRVTFHIGNIKIKCNKRRKNEQ